MYVVLDATRSDQVTFAIIAAEQFPAVAASEARYRSFWVAAFLLSAVASAAVVLSAALGLWRLPLARDRAAITGIILAVIALVIIGETMGPRGEVRWYDSMGRAVIAAADEESTDAAPAPNRRLYRALFEIPRQGAGMTPVAFDGRRHLPQRSRHHLVVPTGARCHGVGIRLVGAAVWHVPSCHGADL